jgi:hypothetical protein
MKKHKKAKQVYSYNMFYDNNFEDRLTKLREKTRDNKFKNTIQHIITQKVEDMQKEVLSELRLLCIEHNIKKDTVEHFVMSSALYDILKQELMFKTINDTLFMKFADKLGYRCHEQDGIYSWIESEDGRDVDESLILK